MSIQAIGDVMRCGPVFKNAEKAVLLGLANHVDQCGHCFPSIQQLCWVTGLHRRTVQKTIPDLEDLAVLEVVEPGGGRRSTRYRLNIEWLEEAAAAIFRTKQKAKQDGDDHYKVMEKVAAEIRRRLERARDSDPICGPRYRERQAKGRGGVTPPLRGGVRPPLNSQPTVENVQDATSGVASDRVGAASDHPSCGVRPPEPSIEYIKSSLETSVEESAPPEPIAADLPQGSNLGEDEQGGDSSHSLRAVTMPKQLQIEHKRVAYKERLADEIDPQSIAAVCDDREAVQKLAELLGKQHHHIALRMGSLTKAAALARQVIEGSVGLDDARQMLEVAA